MVLLFWSRKNFFVEVIPTRKHGLDPSSQKSLLRMTAEDERPPLAAEHVGHAGY
jgi:hypothetical protein